MSAFLFFLGLLLGMVLVKGIAERAVEHRLAPIPPDLPCADCGVAYDAHGPQYFRDPRESSSPR